MTVGKADPYRTISNKSSQSFYADLILVQNFLPLKRYEVILEEIRIYMQNLYAFYLANSKSSGKQTQYVKN